jgi:hypothetical protein
VRRKQRAARWDQATRLKRSFDFDVFTCPGCGGRRRGLAVLKGPGVKEVLRHLGWPTVPWPLASARGPPQGEWLHGKAEAPRHLGFSGTGGATQAARQARSARAGRRWGDAHPLEGHGPPASEGGHRGATGRRGERGRLLPPIRPVGSPHWAWTSRSSALAPTSDRTNPPVTRFGRVSSATKYPAKQRASLEEGETRCLRRGATD